MAKKLVNTEIKLGEGTILEEAISSYIKPLRKTITDTTDLAGHFIIDIPATQYDILNVIYKSGNLGARYVQTSPVFEQFPNDRYLMLIRNQSGTAETSKTYTFEVLYIKK